MYYALIIYYCMLRLRFACKAGFCLKPGVITLRRQCLLYVLLVCWIKLKAIKFSVQFVMVGNLPLQEVSQRVMNNSDHWFKKNVKSDHLLHFQSHIRMQKTIHLWIEKIVVMQCLSCPNGDWGDASLMHFWPTGLFIGLGGRSSRGQICFLLRFIFLSLFCSLSSSGQPYGFQQLLPWCILLSQICSSRGNRVVFQGTHARGRQRDGS